MQINAIGQRCIRIWIVVGKKRLQNISSRKMRCELVEFDMRYIHIS